MTSYIGPFQTSLFELSQEGVSLDPAITAIAAHIEITGKVESGIQWEGEEQADMSPATLSALDDYVSTPAFIQKHEDLTGVKPGRKYQPKSPSEVLAEAQAHPEWSEMEAKMIVDGNPLRELVVDYGIVVYKPVVVN